MHKFFTQLHGPQRQICARSLRVLLMMRVPAFGFTEDVQQARQTFGAARTAVAGGNGAGRDVNAYAARDRAAAGYDDRTGRVWREGEALQATDLVSVLRSDLWHPGDFVYERPTLFGSPSSTFVTGVYEGAFRSCPQLMSRLMCAA